MTLRPDDAVTAVPGVGTKMAERLRRELGVETVRDLVGHYPRRYVDLGDPKPVADATVGEPVTLVGTVRHWSSSRPRTRLTLSRAEVVDQAGGLFAAVFFNQDWRERQLPPGSLAAFSGTLEVFRGRLQLTMPEVRRLRGEGGADLEHRRLLPVYPATEALPTWRLAQWIEAALDRLPPLEDVLPAALREQHRLVSLDTAVRDIHRPDEWSTARSARRRLAFDELFTLQLGVQWRRARLEAGVAGKDNAPRRDGHAAAFVEKLPFALTGAQQRALDEIGGDLAAERPMHRLLQGDVGSGKTVVATWAMLAAVDRGRQAALMVPTEVLAEQHHRTLTELLAPLGVNVLDGVRVELLTSSTAARERRRVVGELLSGAVDVVVGTHALLEEGVAFDDLGVVVVDEQHRFGVAQRAALREKGEAGGAAAGRSMPDVLVMTATPIPRSLALTAYGDLELTVLDELPPGRQPIVTQLITPAEAHRRDRLYAFVREQARAGLQTYVICPLVDESDELDARAALAEHERLAGEVFPDLEVALVHGRMRADEKEAAMAAFRRGAADVLVATTVVEVGVDVPSATIMIIEDAERFGISQLHQLRGRVGRGADKSYCVLLAGWSSELTEDARQRLEAVAGSVDGFELAERDLEIRGEGQLFGERQSGMPDLKLARLTRDGELIALTRRLAQELVAHDRDLAAPEHRSLRHEVVRRYRGGLEELEALASG